MEKTASQILLEAAQLLSEEGRWTKGHYFKFVSEKEKPCMMCAHGAIAYCGNPKIKEQALRKAMSAGWEATVVASHATAAATPAHVNNFYLAKAQEENLSIEEYLSKHYGGQVAIAHYRATKVGLTFDFNDRYLTTKQDVINKLRVAAAQESDQPST